MIYEKLSKIITGEKLYLTALITRLIIATWDSTMFPPAGIVRKPALLIVLVCCVAKIVFYDSYTISEIVVMTAVGGCTVMNVFKTGSSVFFVLFLLVVAAKGVEFSKVIKVYLAVVGSIVFLAFLCSILGVIENLRYRTDSEGYFRGSYGIIYCTDFAAHIFFLVLAYYYLRGKSLSWFDHLGTIVLTLLVYYLSRGKLDSACLIMTVFLFAIGNVITNSEIGISRLLRHDWLSFWRQLSPFFMIFVSLFMIVVTFFYDQDIFWMHKLDDFITTRLSTTKRTLEESGFTLFGQKINIVGYGGTTAKPNGYNFPDCSYLFILITSGLVILVIVLLLYAYGIYRNRSDINLMYAVVLLSINCMISHHLQDIAYNPFTFMIMADVTSNNSKVLYRKKQTLGLRHIKESQNGIGKKV